MRYYAEVERLPLSFFHILDGPIDSERLQMYDFVLVKNSGYQGPEFSTRYTAQIQAHVAREDSGFVLLPQRFSFPDDAHIVDLRCRVHFAMSSGERGDGGGDTGAGR